MPKGRNIGFNSSGGFGIRCALESQFWGTKCWKWWETITFWGRNCHCHCYGECLKHIWTYICISLSLSLCKNTYIYIYTYSYIYIHILWLYLHLYISYQPSLNHVGVSILHPRHHQKWPWWWIAGLSRDGNDITRETGGFYGPVGVHFVDVHSGCSIPWSMHLSTIHSICKM